MTERERRDKVCAQARSWLGRREADGSFREIIDVYNAGRPAGSYRMTYTDPWCAAFVSAVGMAAGLGDIVLPHVNCDGMIAAYKARGRWVEDDGYLPQPGDLIFFDWEDSGRGDNTGSADHVAIVVGSTGYYLTLAEGNSSDMVKLRTVARNSRAIRGFAVPEYEKTAGNRQQASGEDTASAPRVPSPQEKGKEDSVALPALAYGDEGEAVRAAQILLYGRGFPCGPDGADGEFGPNTRAAVRACQRVNGLGGDGAIGPRTWAALLGVRA